MFSFVLLRQSFISQSVVIPLVCTVEKKKGNYNGHLNHIENAHKFHILCDIWGLSHIVFTFSLAHNHAGCDTFV